MRSSQPYPRTRRPARKRTGPQSPPRPGRLDARVQATARSLAGLRRRWTDWLDQVEAEGMVLSVSALADADRLYTEVAEVLEAVEQACIGDRTSGHVDPALTGVERTATMAALRVSRSNDLMLEAARLAAGDKALPPDATWLVLRAFDVSFGCLSDVLAAYVDDTAGDGRRAAV